MNVIAVDDEKHALSILVDAIKTARPDAVVKSCEIPEQALKYAERIPCDIVFLDVEMRAMNGIELAKQLKIQKPNINIIFVTGYRQYGYDAFSIHASGYLLKPVTAEKIAVEIEHLRYPIEPYSSGKRVRVHTFGDFEVYVDGIPASFHHNKTKELFAYLVDRNGAVCTNDEIMAALWGDQHKISYFKKLRTDLLNTLPNTIFVRQWGKLGILTDSIDCDYYDWIKGMPPAINAYRGEYMAQYDWSELTHGQIMRKYYERVRI